MCLYAHARPAIIAPSQPALVENVVALVAAEQASEVVVGLPLSLSGGIPARPSPSAFSWPNSAAVSPSPCSCGMSDSPRCRQGEARWKPAGASMGARSAMLPAMLRVGQNGAIAASWTPRPRLWSSRLSSILGGDRLLSMSEWRSWTWPAAGALIVILATLLASYLIARTPGDVLGAGLVSSTPASAPGAQVSYTLAEGRTASQVGSDLQHLGIISSARQFELLVSLMGVQDRLSAGDYTLKKNSPTALVVNELTVKDSVPVQRVTFPEGLRVEEMAVLAEKAGFGTAQQFLDAVTNAVPPSDIAAMVPAAGTVPGYRLQGFLFPDTYILPAGSSDAQLVQLMLQTFSERYSHALRDDASAQGLTPYQVLTMASIIEREAVLPTERPIIAGVFYNRLAAHDLIGADATVQFAVALDPASVAKYGYWKKELTLDDLATRSPYNTRLFPGLPPGPIANPGLASIEAAAEPAKTDYYFFVANAKKADGSHVFAVTQAQQDQNIAEYGSP